ncbi:MAG TPA: hypothetical protein VN802_14880, partial [Stellaceae bacterium]|nr:hypothetical protein [Stellaceae bacterium]
AGGTTTIAAANVTLQGSNSAHGGFAQIGFAGAGATGAVTVATSGDVTLTAGTAGCVASCIGAPYAQIGHGGFEFSGSAGGAITVTAGGNVTLTATGAPFAYAQIGNGDASLSTFGNDVSGNIIITAGGTVSVTSNSSPAFIGNATTGGTSSGDLVLIGAALTSSGGALENFLQADIQGGDVTRGVTSPLSASGIQNDIFYDSPHTLTALVAGSIDIEGNIQNAGSGAVNVVAGWDGTHGLALPSTTFNLADITGHPSSFANNSGAVTVGNGDQLETIAVGSLQGATTILGASLTLQGSVNAEAGAQVGYNTSNDFGVTATGPINVQVTGDVILTAGQHNFEIGSYVQIGHGGLGEGGSGSTSSTTSAASITVNAGGTVTLSGGEGAQSYAQIGHGGFQSIAIESGSFAENGLISVTGGSMSLSGGAGSFAYAQIGHGGGDAGVFTDGVSLTLGGAITLSAPTGSIVLTGGSGSDAYAQIGHGGSSLGLSLGTFSASGTIGITAQSVMLTGNVGSDSYAQIGHGGAFSVLGATGDIGLTLSGDVNLAGGNEIDTQGAYAQIGNGGFSASGDVGGEITVSGANATLTGGAGNAAYAQIGHGGAFDFGTASGDIGLTLGGNLTLKGNVGFSAQGSYAQVGNGGYEGFGSATGTITVQAANVTLTGGEGQSAYAQIGNGGSNFNLQLDPASIAESGDITVTVDPLASFGTLMLTGGVGSGAYVQIGNGGDSVNAGVFANSGDIAMTGAIAVTAGQVALAGSSGLHSYAQIGNGGASANIDASASGSILIGDAGSTVAVTLGGSSQSITLTGGTGGGAYAQIGNGGISSNATATGGAVTVTVSGAGSSLALSAGPSDGSGDYAMIGNGDPLAFSTGNVSGDVTVTVGGTTTLTNTGDSVAFIGNLTSSGTAAGNVTLTTGAIVNANGAVENLIDYVLGGGVSDSESLTLNLTGGGVLSLTGGSISIDSAQTLTLNAPLGTIDLEGSFSNAGAGALNVTAASIILAGSATTAGGAITFNGPVVMADDLTVATNGGEVASGANITFNGTLDDLPGFPGSAGIPLDAGSAGVIAMLGAVGGITPIAYFAVDSAASVQLHGNIITQGSAVTFSGMPVTLATNVTIDTTGNTAVPDGNIVSFGSGSTVDSTNGTQSLTITAGVNNVTFGDAVGQGHPLGGLTVTAGSFDASSKVSTNGPLHVTTSVGDGEEDGHINFADTVTTGGGAFGASATGSDPMIDVNGAVTTAGGPVTLSASGTSGATITIENITVTTGGGAFSASATAADPTVTVLGTVSTGGSSFSASVTDTDAGEIDIDGTVNTSGGPVNLTASGSGDATIRIEGGSVTTNGGTVTLSASTTGVGADEIYAAALFIDGSISSGIGNVNGTATATGSGEAAIETSAGIITATTGSVSLTAMSPPLAEMDLTGTIQITGNGNITLLTSDSLMLLDGPLITNGGTLSATASGPGSIMQVNCGCGTPIQTGNGTVVLEVNGVGSELVIDDPLVLSGPTTLVSQGSPNQPSVIFNGGVSGNFPLTIATDGTVSPSPLGYPYTPLTYEEFTTGIFPSSNGTGATGVGSTDPGGVINQPGDLLNNPNPIYTVLLPPPGPPLPPDFIPPPPPPPEEFTFDTGSIDTGTGPPALTSVTDLDVGREIFAGISPGFGAGFDLGFIDPLFFVPPVTLAQQPQPKPESPDTLLSGIGGHLFQSQRTFVHHDAANDPSEGGSDQGNRSLWFAILNGE